MGRSASGIWPRTSCIWPGLTLAAMVDPTAKRIWVARSRSTPGRFVNAASITPRVIALSGPSKTHCNLAWRRKLRRSGPADPEIGHYAPWLELKANPRRHGRGHFALMRKMLQEDER